MSTQKRLYRSETDRMLGGVCGGLGEYLGMDPTLVRLIFVLLFLVGGHGLLVYLIMLIVVPNEPIGAAPVQQVRASEWKAEEPAPPAPPQPEI